RFIMKEQIFIVDDDYEVCKSIKRLLKSEGYTVRTFTSSEDFLKDLPCENSGCLILDVIMPGMNGLELQEYLNSSGYKMPVIFVTAAYEACYRERALNAGAAGYILKPFRAGNLLNLIYNVMKDKKKSVENKNNL
ncbi:MAG: response regulator, partial [Candidatus Eremiobacterota bacterium]